MPDPAVSSPTSPDSLPDPVPAGQAASLGERLRLLGRGVPPSLRSTITYGFGIAWSRGVGLAMVPVMTAHLVPAEFGRLELLASAAEIAGLMVGAGLVDTLFRFASGRGAEGRRMAAEVMGLTLGIGLVCLVLVLVLAGPIAGAMPLATPTRDIVLLGVLIVMDAVIGVALAWLRMRGRAGAHAMAAGLRATVQAVLIAGLLVMGTGVTGVLAGSALAALATAAVLTRRQALDTSIAFAPSGMGRLLAYSVPLVGSGLASFVLGSADRWLLAGSVDPAALGQYALASRFALIVAMLMQPFDLWWYARRLAMLEQPDGVARTGRVVRLGMAGIAVSAALTASIGPPLIHLLAPASYAPAMAMVPWLVLSLSLQMLSSLANVGCYAGRTTAVPLAVNAAAAAVALGLYVLLIPLHGVNGAIAATVAAQAARLTLFTLLAQRRVSIDLPYGATAVMAASAACAAAATQILPEGWSAVASAACLLATALIGFVLFRRPGSPAAARG